MSSGDSARQLYAAPDAVATATRQGQTTASHQRPKSAGVMRRSNHGAKAVLEVGQRDVSRCGKATTRFVTTVQQTAERRLPVYFKSMRHAFRAVDRNKTGALNKEAFTWALRKLQLVSDKDAGSEAFERQVDTMFRMCDRGNTGTVSAGRCSEW